MWLLTCLGKMVALLRKCLTQGMYYMVKLEYLLEISVFCLVQSYKCPGRIANLGTSMNCHFSPNNYLKYFSSYSSVLIGLPYSFPKKFSGNLWKLIFKKNHRVFLVLFMLLFPPFSLGERPLNLRMPNLQNRQPHHFVVDGELSRLYSSEAKSQSGKNMGYD